VNAEKKMNLGESRDYMFRIRYRQKLFGAKIESLADGFKIQSNEPMKSVAPGQFASWYDGNELVGSGIIHS
jgi:tRNA-specific 2-thiouridylase